jgi:hypothetical protein
MKAAAKQDDASAAGRAAFAIVIVGAVLAGIVITIFFGWLAGLAAVVLVLIAAIFGNKPLRGSKRT